MQLKNYIPHLSEENSHIQILSEKRVPLKFFLSLPLPPLFIL